MIQDSKTHKTADVFYIQHAQHQDSRRYFCHKTTSYNKKVIFSHFVVVYDVPKVVLEYVLKYEVALCEDLMMAEKAENLRELMTFSRFSKHHGLVYTIRHFSCDYFEEDLTSVATFYISCEHRIKDVYESCDTIDCYLKKSSAILLNSSFDSFKRWFEIEAHPGKYSLNKTIKMPQFKLIKKPQKYRYIYECPKKYSLWKNTICIPCLNGYFYNNQTKKCEKCPKNTYQSFTLSLDCILCPKGSFTKNEGSFSSSSCLKSSRSFYFFVQHHKEFFTVVILLFVLLMLLSYFKNKYLHRKKDGITHEKMDTPQLLPDEILKKYDKKKKMELNKMCNKPMVVLDKVEFLKKAQKNKKNLPRTSKTYVFAF